jgi:hypothetical protein
MIECQGNCTVHRGTIKRVEVRDIRHGKDWGLFSYCDEAIEENLRRGLDVSILDHVPTFLLPASGCDLTSCNGEWQAVSSNTSREASGCQ